MSVCQARAWGAPFFACPEGSRRAPFVKGGELFSLLAIDSTHAARPHRFPARPLLAASGVIAIATPERLQSSRFAPAVEFKNQSHLGALSRRNCQPSLWRILLSRAHPIPQ